MARIPMLAAVLGAALSVVLFSAGRAWAATGDISTVAGNGHIGASGDGGPATSAGLDYPTSVAADGFGNFYMASGTVRKVDVAGVINTIAVGSGVTVDAAGNLFYAGSDGIFKLSPSGTTTEVVAEQFAGPIELGLDKAGNVYVASQGDERVYKVDASGTITVIAGNGTLGFSGDGGPATAAQFNDPAYVAVDTHGNIYISDALNNRVRKVDTTGTITTFAGNGQVNPPGDGGPATSATIAGPRGLAFDGEGNLYIADEAHNTVHEVDATGTITRVVGNDNFGFSGDAGPAISAMLANPAGIAFDPQGNLYIADAQNYRIRKVEAPATPPPALPESPYIVLLPLSGVVVLGLGLRLRGRRLKATTD